MVWDPGKYRQAKGDAALLLAKIISMRDRRAMERTSRKAYQPREKLLDWREIRSQKN